MTGIKLIALLIIMGGAIAYLGDVLGRKVGKKKISILGLRPKYSAIVITIISGILIVSFTLIVLGLISREVRIALFGVEKLQSDLLKAKKNVRNLSSKLYSLSKDVSFKEKKLVVLENSLKDAENAKDRINQDLISSQREREKLKKVQDELTGKISSLYEEKAHLENRVENLRKQGDEIFERLKKTQEEITLLENKRKEIDEEKKKIEIKLKEAMTGKIIIPVDYELSTLVILPTYPLHKIREELVKKLVEINEWAKVRGAYGKDGNDAIVVWDTQIEGLVEQIINKKVPVVVRFLSSQNVVEGEPLYIKFEVIENKIIAKRGEVLSEGIVDPQQSQQEIEKSLLLLLKEARENTISRGIKPAGSGEIGGISALKFYNIVSLIKKSPVKLKVSVVPTDDVYIVDTLEVDFRIREVK